MPTASYTPPADAQATPPDQVSLANVQPDDTLRNLLEQTVRSLPGSTNACAFVDPLGNVLVVAADQQHVNAVCTASALCTRAYAQTRFALMADRASSDVASFTLTNPNFGTFVWLTAPDPRTALGMLDIGAYGSNLGSPGSPLIPSAFQYYDLPAGLSAQELQSLIYPLPPLYSEHIAISPQQTPGQPPVFDRYGWLPRPESHHKGRKPETGNRKPASRSWQPSGAQRPRR